MIEKMVDVIVEDGYIVDLGGASTLYIPRDAKFIKNYDDLIRHDHIENILVDEENEYFFAENDCLMQNMEHGWIGKNCMDSDYAELVVGCKNSVIPEANGATWLNIGRLAFSGVDIKSINLPQNTYEIGLSAFMESTLEQICLNDGLFSIRNMAFVFTNLKSVVIPETTELIGVGVFAGCQKLESLTVEEGNEVYYSENNCLISKEEKTLVACVSDAVIPEGVKTIEAMTFYGMDKDSVVTIPESVRKIRKLLICPPVCIEFPVTFKAPKGSYAIEFAKENGIKYIEM